jgi:cobalamin biosynthesis Mg chelatase CobN
VLWTNLGSTRHTVTADNGVFRSGEMTPGATFRVTFNGAGTFPYHCDIHGAAMSGVVRVAAAPTTARPTTTVRPTTTTARATTTTRPATTTSSTTSTSSTSTSTSTTLETTTTEGVTTSSIEPTTALAAPEASEDTGPSALTVALLAAAVAAVAVGIGAIVRRLRAG